MSIYAITSNIKSEAAEIPWLHQCYCLDRVGGAYCILELVVNVLAKGGEALRHLEIFVPSTVTNLSDNTSDLLKTENKFFYSNGYELLSLDSKKPLSGNIILDGIKARVEEISLTQQPFMKWTKLIVSFHKPIQKKESRAIRIRYDIKTISERHDSGLFSITLRYYQQEAAAYFRLDPMRAIKVNNLFVWLILPTSAEVMPNPSFPFVRQVEIKSPLQYYEVFFGKRYKEIWEGNSPTQAVMWKQTGSAEKPVLFPWISSFFYCRYILKDRSRDEENPVDKNETKGLEYEVWLFKDHKSKIPYSLLKKDYLNRIKYYDLFVDETKGEVFFGKIYGEKLLPMESKKGKEISLIRGKPFDVLVRFLKRDGNGGTADQIFDDVWGGGSEAIDTYDNRVEQVMTDLRKKLKKIVGIKCLNKRYQFSKQIKYCLIKEKEQ